MLQKETEDEKRYSEFFERFFTKEGSILKGYLVRAERIPGKISRKTFNNSIINLLEKTLAEVSNDDVYNIINNYLKAAQAVLSEIDGELNDAVTKPVIFQSFMKISTYVLDKTYSKHSKLTIESFYDILKVLKSNISKNYLLRPGNSYNKLSERLLDSLTKIVIRPGTITEN